MNHSAIDLMILTLQALDLNAKQTFQKIKDSIQPSAPPIIAISSQTDDEFCSSILKAGYDAYLAKSIAFQILMATISR